MYSGYIGANNIRENSENVHDASKNPFINPAERSRLAREARILNNLSDIVIYCGSTDCADCKIKLVIECEGKLGKCAVPLDWDYYKNKRKRGFH